MEDELETLSLCCEPYTGLAESAAMCFRALQLHGIDKTEAIATTTRLCIEHAQCRANDYSASSMRSGSRWERDECRTWSGVLHRLTRFHDSLIRTAA